MKLNLNWLLQATCFLSLLVAVTYATPMPTETQQKLPEPEVKARPLRRGSMKYGDTLPTANKSFTSTASPPVRVKGPNTRRGKRIEMSAKNETLLPSVVQSQANHGGIRQSIVRMPYRIKGGGANLEHQKGRNERNNSNEASSSVEQKVQSAENSRSHESSSQEQSNEHIRFMAQKEVNVKAHDVVRIQKDNSKEVSIPGSESNEDSSPNQDRPRRRNQTPPSKGQDIFNSPRTMQPIIVAPNVQSPHVIKHVPSAALSQNQIAVVQQYEIPIVQKTHRFMQKPITSTVGQPNQHKNHDIPHPSRYSEEQQTPHINNNNNYQQQQRQQHHSQISIATGNVRQQQQPKQMQQRQQQRQQQQQQQQPQQLQQNLLTPTRSHSHQTSQNPLITSRNLNRNNPTNNSNNNNNNNNKNSQRNSVEIATHSGNNNNNNYHRSAAPQENYITAPLNVAIQQQQQQQQRNSATNIANGGPPHKRKPSPGITAAVALATPTTTTTTPRPLFGIPNQYNIFSAEFWQFLNPVYRVSPYATTPVPPAIITTKKPPKKYVPPQQISSKEEKVNYAKPPKPAFQTQEPIYKPIEYRDNTTEIRKEDGPFRIALPTFNFLTPRKDTIIESEKDKRDIENERDDLRAKVNCPRESEVRFQLFPKICKIDDDCKTWNRGEICCDIFGAKSCVAGVPKPLEEAPHSPILGLIPRKCPDRPLAELWWEVQECETDMDCWPRVCCPDGRRRYCRTSQPELNTVPVPVQRSFNYLTEYLECTAPPPRIFDLHPKACTSTLDCFPNVCCQEAGLRHCRPPKKSVLTMLANVFNVDLVKRLTQNIVIK